ncbi:MAG: hypothetical protein M3157_03950 [Actinomycetota bacterium]|nr:hypothetical protein [Actinomycetota bacterium]
MDRASKRGEVNVIADDGRRSLGAGPARRLLTGQRSRKAAGLLEEMLRAMVEDNELHPAVEYVYAALYEAESRAVTRRVYPRPRGSSTVRPRRWFVKP